MNKKSLIAIVIAGVVVLGGGVTYALVQKNNDEKAAMKASEQSAMEKEDTTVAKNDTMARDDSKMEKMDNEAMAAHGSYLTLADYNANKDKYADDKKVLFFHAAWCPICRSIEKDITDDPSKLPAKTVLIKTDFDSETELRQKYGVTMQHTFVQINSDGSLIKKWSGTSTNSALKQIQ